MIVLSLVGLFVLAVQEALNVGIGVTHASDEREEIRLQLANALEQLTREASLASNVDNAEDQRLQFDADLDGNGSTEGNINYEVQSGDLNRVYSGETVTLARDLSALDFNYTDLNGSSVSTPAGSQPIRDSIRVVQITMTATKHDETISLSSAVFLRNNS